MSKDISLKHPIRQYILEQLSQQESCRFSDLRPPRTDTNLVAYHVGVLVDAGVLVRTDDVYTLGPQGLAHVQQRAAAANTAQAGLLPIVEVWFVVQNSEGDILLQRRAEQPFLGSASLPYGRVDATDSSVRSAAARIGQGLWGSAMPEAHHAGDCYVRVAHGSRTVVTTLVHVFRCNSDTIVPRGNLQWARPHRLAQYQMTPGVEDVMARTFFHDPFFFEEFSRPWQTTQ